jgi:hypothetical protein
MDMEGTYVTAQAAGPRRTASCAGAPTSSRPNQGHRRTLQQGNAFPLSSSYWTYDGGINYPVDVAQNVPGAIYNTESMFEWMNNPYGPPSSDPPMGIGTIPVSSVGSLWVRRIRASLPAGCQTPQGASVQVPQTVYLSGFCFWGISQPCTTGVMVLTATDALGGRPVQPHLRYA